MSDTGHLDDSADQPSAIGAVQIEWTWHLCQLRGAQVQIVRRRPKARMTQQNLYRPNVRAAVEQMRGEAVPERVR